MTAVLVAVGAACLAAAVLSLIGAIVNLDRHDPVLPYTVAAVAFVFAATLALGLA